MSRLLRRAITRWLIVALFLGSIIFGTIFLLSNQPPSQAELQRQEQALEKAQKDWAENGAAKIEECRQQAAKATPYEPEAAAACEQMGPPTAEKWGWKAPVLSETFRSITKSAPMTIGILALLLGASLIEAEFASGSMSTWLTFEPRRGRIFVTKMSAAAVGLFLLGALGLIMVNLTAWLVTTLNGWPGGFTSEVTKLFLGESARALLTIIFMGLFGAALAFILRHTGAVDGLALGYLMVVDQILMGFIPAWKPWSINYTLDTFITGRNHYLTSSCATAADGRWACTPVDHTLLWSQAGGFLLAVLTVLTLIGYLLFKRRDVN